MTLNVTPTAEQEAALRFFRKKHNAVTGASLTAAQYGEQVAIQQKLDGLVDAMTTERAGSELTEAFKAASGATQDQVRQLLGISNP